MKNTRKDIYKEVTDRIAAQLSTRIGMKSIKT